MHVFLIDVLQLEREFGFGAAGDVAKVVARRLEHLLRPLFGRCSRWHKQEQTNRNGNIPQHAFSPSSSALRECWKRRKLFYGSALIDSEAAASTADGQRPYPWPPHKWRTTSHASWLFRHCRQRAERLFR